MKILMSPLRSIVCVTAICAIASLAGCASAPESTGNHGDGWDAPHAQRAGRAHRASDEEYGVTKSAWMHELPGALADDLCADNEIFRSCYPVSADECRQRARAVTEDCDGQYDSSIPSRLHGEDESRWGATIGHCAGEKLNEALLTAYTFNESDACKRALGE